MKPLVVLIVTFRTLRKFKVQLLALVVEYEILKLLNDIESHHNSTKSSNSGEYNA